MIRVFLCAALGLFVLAGASAVRAEEPVADNGFGGGYFANAEYPGLESTDAEALSAVEPAAGDEDGLVAPSSVIMDATIVSGPGGNAQPTDAEAGGVDNTLAPFIAE